MAGGQAKAAVKEPNDWQTVNDPGDWQTVAPSSTHTLQQNLNIVSGKAGASGEIPPPPPPGLTESHPVTGFVSGLSNFGAGGLAGIKNLVSDPIGPLKAIYEMGSPTEPMGLHSIYHSSMPPQAAQLGQNLQNKPAETLTYGAGNIAGPAALLGLAGEAPGALSDIRTAAIGDPDAAALRGLRVGPGSPKALRTLSAVQGARPYLQGAQSLEDVQARVPGAKSEVWGPYQKTIDAIGGKKVMGPDGETTVAQLEAERQQLSALNRELRSRAPNPESVKLAEQKGMNQAQLLAREKAVQNALDPELGKAGIDAKTIRQTFGQIAQVGERVSGKSTLAEPSKPYGFAKLGDLNLTKPLSNIPLVGSAARDVAAGRYWNAKPTDVALRDAFRLGGEKPDFRAPMSAMGRYEQPPRQLEANVPGNAGYGDYDRGSMAGIPHPGPQITPPPALRLLLPASASAGEPQPMIGGTWKPIEPPSSNDLHIFPPGSAYRNVPTGLPEYPPASQFRTPAKSGLFDIDEYLRTHR